MLSSIVHLALHPYYKLMYIEMAWGGAEEQQKEREAGNPNAKDWYDEATKTVEKTMADYWDQTKPSTTITKLAASLSLNDQTSKHPLESEFDRHRREYLQQASVRSDSGGWKTELRRYLNDIPTEVSKETNIVTWWAVWHISYISILVLKSFQTHSNEYPTLSRIAMDVCAIPATSVPCERLFSAGAEVATDRRSRLGADKFEQLQILKHTWRDNIVDVARLNSSTTEEEYLDEFRELFKRDVELVEWDGANETVIL